MWAGPQAVAIMEGVHLPLRALLTGVTFVTLGSALLVLYRRASGHGGLTAPRSTSRLRETASPETAVLAGFLATIEMGLGVNLLLYGLSAVEVLRPEAALISFLRLAAERFTAGSVPRLVLLLVLLILTVNIGMALLYARVGVRSLPGPPWLEGLLFAVVPFLLWGLVVLPLCGAGPFGLGLGAGWWPLAGEAVRHALFGVGLGVSHALLARARTRPMMPLPTTEKPLVSG